MIHDIELHEFTEDFFGFKPRIAGITPQFPHIMFLGRYQTWRSTSALWGFEEQLGFTGSVITHETMHLVFYKLGYNAKKFHKGFDEVCKRLLNTPFSLMRFPCAGEDKA